MSAVAAHDELDALVRARVATVLDPCGVRNGTRLSFVELGMYDGVEQIAPGRIRVRMLLDDPVCMYMSEIQRSVRDAVLGIDGVQHVEVSFVGDRFWTTDLLTPQTQERMARWRLVRQRRMAQRTQGLAHTTNGDAHVDDQQHHDAQPAHDQR